MPFFASGNSVYGIFVARISTYAFWGPNSGSSQLVWTPGKLCQPGQLQSSSILGNTVTQKLVFVISSPHQTPGYLLPTSFKEYWRPWRPKRLKRPWRPKRSKRTNQHYLLIEGSLVSARDPVQLQGLHRQTSSYFQSAPDEASFKE